MRTLVAIAVFAVGMLALDSTADAARNSKRSAKAYHSQQSRADAVCVERALHEDRTGQFAGYPCWAREAFARGRNSNRQ